MGLATLFKKLGAEHGIEIDEDELTQLGLSDDDQNPVVDVTGTIDLDVLDEVLSGEAAGAVEIFLSDPRSMLADKKAIESDGLMWEPIIREGQWAMRPGGPTGKRRSPLKVVAGKSKDARKQIGLQDIVDAFDDVAIEHVTVPTSHDNKVTENTGFIKGLKIVKAKVKDKLSKKDKEVAVLMGGYDIRLPEIKRQMDLGTIASRSAGLLYDYVNTETGKTYGVVLEHVALTNKPWITGMKAFGRKLVGKKLADTIGLSLSDEEPRDEDLLSSEDVLGSIELAEAASTWSQDEDPDWLREQTNAVLRAARAKKAALKGANDSYLVYEGLPNYRCVRAKPGMALVADGWGDEANFWTAPITIVDGYVEVGEADKWQAIKREYVNDDDRKEFPEGREPLKDEQDKPGQQLSEDDVLESLTEMAKAQRARRDRGRRISSTDLGENTPDDKTTTHPRGGEHMAGESGTLQLSDEARKMIEAANKRADDAVKAAEKLSETVDKLLGAHTATNAATFVAQLKADGFNEENGFSGVLVEVQDLLSADDGAPALQSDKFADETNTTGELTLSDAIGRIFKAFKRGEDGKLALGQQVVQPVTTPVEKDENGEVKLGEDGKPLPATAEEKSFDELSEAEQEAALLADNPGLLGMLRIPAPSANGSEAS